MVLLWRGRGETEIRRYDHADGSFFAPLTGKDVIWSYPQATTPMGRTDLPNLPQWKLMVSEALSAIRRGELDKVVLARRTTLRFKAPLDPMVLFHHLFHTRPLATVFLHPLNPTTTFLGATPEMLFERVGRQISCDALAGTGALSDKNRREFEWVRAYIEQKLTPFCSSGHMEKEPSIRKAANVQHLYSQFTGILHPHISDQMLLNTLHPTPALGGHPKDAALALIQKLEPFERGWYGGPIGYMSNEETRYAVAIRSVLIQEDTVHLFSGAGIVEGSIAEKEWEELEAKIAPYLEFFQDAQ